MGVKVNDGKFIQEVHGYVSWAKNGAFKEKHCANKIIEAAKAYADAQVEASVARQQPIFEAAMNAKNAEIAELKAILTKILALPDDTAAAYIKALIHDQIKLK